MRSFRAIYNDLKKLTNELHEASLHFEKLRETVDVENDETDRFDIYDDLYSCAEAVAITIEDTFPEMDDCVDYERDLEDLERSSNQEL